MPFGQFARIDKYVGKLCLVSKRLTEASLDRRRRLPMTRGHALCRVSSLFFHVVFCVDKVGRATPQLLFPQGRLVLARIEDQKMLSWLVQVGSLDSRKTDGCQ